MVSAVVYCLLYISYCCACSTEFCSGCCAQALRKGTLNLYLVAVQHYVVCDSQAILLLQRDYVFVEPCGLFRLFGLFVAVWECEPIPSFRILRFDPKYSHKNTVVLLQRALLRV